MEQSRVEEKIVNLKEILEYIQNLVTGDKKTILTNRLVMDSLENNIRKAIQIMIDLASDIVSKNKLRNVQYVLSNFWKVGRKWIYI